MNLLIPYPGMFTLRSRGIDIIAIRDWSGSRRSSIVVSERPGSPGVPARLSEPRIRMFCGPLEGTSSSGLSCLCSLSPCPSASAMSLRYSRIVEEVAAATAAMITKEASEKRHQYRFGFGAGS